MKYSRMQYLLGKLKENHYSYSLKSNLQNLLTINPVEVCCGCYHVFQSTVLFIFEARI